MSYYLVESATRVLISSNSRVLTTLLSLRFKPRTGWLYKVMICREAASPLP